MSAEQIIEGFAIAATSITLVGVLGRGIWKAAGLTAKRMDEYKEGQKLTLPGNIKWEEERLARLARAQPQPPALTPKVGG